MIFFEQRVFIASVSLPTLNIDDSSYELSLKLKFQRTPKGIRTKTKRHRESAVTLFITSAFSFFQLQ